MGAGGKSHLLPSANRLRFDAKIALQGSHFPSFTTPIRRAISRKATPADFYLTMSRTCRMAILSLGIPSPLSLS
jgi:hypothetical protein